MTFIKDKKCFKYFIMAGVILLCLYSNVLADLFIPLVDNIYYGNLTKMFVALISAAFWGIEIGLIVFACKKLNITLLTEKENKKQELKTWKVITLFVLTILPIIVVSACINWTVKIVYALGVKVTAVGLLCNVSEILCYAVRMILMILFIASIQKGFESIFKTKFVVPYGAVFAFLTFGLIDFFFFPADLRVFYLVVSFLYGIIYIVAEKKFLPTWALCYIIYLL